MSLNNTSICNYLNTDEAEAYSYTVIELTLVIGLVPLISSIGILANSAFLFTLYRVHHMRSTTNVYLANLAVADGMLLVVRSIRYTGTYLYSPIDYFNLTPFTNRFSCGIPLLLIWWLSFVSVDFVCLVAFERYMSICRPVKHRKTSNRERPLKMSMISWMVPFAIVACHGGFFRIVNICLIWPADKDLSISFSTCPVSDGANLSITLIGLCQFLIACIGNCMLYIFIIRSLDNRKLNSRKKTKERNHVAKMLSINACVFFICLTPMQVLSLVELLTTTSKLVNDLMFWIAILAASLNSAVNPLIYNASNPEYRKAFRRAFSQHFTLNRRSSDTSSL